MTDALFICFIEICEKTGLPVDAAFNRKTRSRAG